MEKFGEKENQTSVEIQTLIEFQSSEKFLNIQRLVIHNMFQIWQNS